MSETKKEITPALLGMSHLAMTTATALRAHGDLFEAGPINHDGDRVCRGCGQVLEDPDSFDCVSCEEDRGWEMQARLAINNIDRGGCAEPIGPGEVLPLAA